MSWSVTCDCGNPITTNRSEVECLNCQRVHQRPFDIESAKKAVGYCGYRIMDPSTKNNPIREYHMCGIKDWLCHRCQALKDAVERITQLEMELFLEERDSWHRRDVLKYVGPVIAAARAVEAGLWPRVAPNIEGLRLDLSSALAAYDKRVEQELGG